MTPCLFRFAFVLKFEQICWFRFDFKVPVTRSANVGAFCYVLKKHVLLSINTPAIVQRRVCDNAT